MNFPELREDLAAGICLLDLLIGIFLSAVILMGAISCLRQVSSSGGFLKNKVLSSQTLERVEALLSRDAERSLGFLSLPGVSLERGSGPLHLYLSAHSSTPPKSGSDLLGFRILGSQVIFPRQIPQEVFCQASLGFPAIPPKNPWQERNEMRFGVLLSLSGPFDVRFRSVSDLSDCPWGFRIKDIETLQIQFQTISPRVPKSASHLGILPIENAHVYFVDQENSLRRFSLLHHSNQVLVEHLDSILCERTAQGIHCLLREDREMKSRSVDFSLPSSTYSFLDLLL